MNNFRTPFVVLAVVALATSAYGFKVTNVTNNEVVFHCSWEKGTAGENIQADTPEIGTFNFLAFGGWPPELRDGQVDCHIEDVVTNPPTAAYYGNNYAYIAGMTTPVRPWATAEFVGTPSADGDLMQIEFAVMSIDEWPPVSLMQTPSDLVYTDPDFHAIGNIMFTGNGPPWTWEDPGWMDPGGIISQADGYEFILDAHTVGAWNEVVMEYVNGSTDLALTINGVGYTLTNMNAGILNYVRIGNGANNTVGYFDAPAGAVELLADFNNDGVIDDLDLTILANNWDTCGKDHSQGDANDDGCVDDLDLTALANEWPSGDLDVSAVPEPALLSMLALGGLAALRRRRR